MKTNFSPTVVHRIIRFSVWVGGAAALTILTSGCVTESQVHSPRYPMQNPGHAPVNYQNTTPAEPSNTNAPVQYNNQ